MTRKPPEQTKALAIREHDRRRFAEQEGTWSETQDATAVEMMKMKLRHKARSRAVIEQLLGHSLGRQNAPTSFLGTLRAFVAGQTTPDPFERAYTLGQLTQRLFEKTLDRVDGVRRLPHCRTCRDLGMIESGTDLIPCPSCEDKAANG